MRIVWAFVAVTLLAAPSLFGDEPAYPKPNPAAPVNYIEWLNKTMGGDIKENAADVYREAWGEATTFEGDWDEVLDGPWSDNPAVEEWLHTNRDALALFRKAASMKDCFFTLSDPPPTGDRRQDHMLLSAMRPEVLSGYRQLVRGLMAEGWRTRDADDRNTLPENALLVLRSSQHLDRSGLLLHHLVGMACRGVAREKLRKALEISEKPAELAARVLPRLQSDDSPTDGWARVLLIQRLSMLDFAQRLFVPIRTSDAWNLDPDLVEMLTTSFYDKRLYGEDRWKAFKEMVADLPTLGFDGAVEGINHFYDELQRWTAIPYHKAGQEVARFDQIAEETRNPFVCASDMLPVARGLGEQDNADRRATHLILHLFVHRGRAGAFPASLDELDLPKSAETRIDPFSGRDFVYRKTAEGFILYSVGANFKDDGGKHDRVWLKEGRDFVFWPVQESKVQPRTRASQPSQVKP